MPTTPCSRKTCGRAKPRRISSSWGARSRSPLPHAEQRLQGGAAQVLLHRALLHRFAQDRKYLVVDVQQLGYIVVAVGVGHIVGPKRENASCQRLLHEEGLDFPLRAGGRVRELQESPGRVAG